MRDERAASLLATRLLLGTSILFGLEFMIVSDLIHSLLTHNLESLTSLGLLVLICTMIRFFLGRDPETVAESRPLEAPSAIPR